MPKLKRQQGDKRLCCCFCEVQDSTLFRPRVKLFIRRQHGVCAADGMLRSFGVINAAGGVVVGQRDAMLFHHGIGVGMADSRLLVYG